MAGRLSREELDALLGAHALDADEPAEREQVEQYLAENPTARAEVDSRLRRYPVFLMVARKESGGARGG